MSASVASVASVQSSQGGVMSIAAQNFVEPEKHNQEAAIIKAEDYSKRTSASVENSGDFLPGAPGGPSGTGIANQISENIAASKLKNKNLARCFSGMTGIAAYAAGVCTGLMLVGVLSNPIGLAIALSFVAIGILGVGYSDSFGRALVATVWAALYFTGGLFAGPCFAAI